MKNITERLHRAFRKHDIALYTKAGVTIRNAVVSPKNPLELGEQCGVIYVPVMYVVSYMWGRQEDLWLRELMNMQSP